MRIRSWSCLTLALVAVLTAVVETSSVTAAPTYATLFGTTTPQVQSFADDQRVELGVQFTSGSAGDVTGIRFYKGTRNTGVHTGSLWANGTQLATATFQSETASGWQQVTFPKPVPVSPGQVYTASYLAPNGWYSVNGTYSWPATSGVLKGIKGTYRYGGGYPTRVYASANYWVDVLFTPIATPRTSSAQPATTSISPSTSPVTRTSSQTATSSMPTSTTSGTSNSTTTSATTTSNSPSAGSWPDASNTGVAGCPALEKVNNGDQVLIDQDNTTYENKELMNPAVITIRGARNVTIRCVKWHGTGYFGIDNTDRPSPAGTFTDVVVDRVDIDCQDKGQVIGMLLKAATITRANVHNCDHMLNAGGDNVIIKDSYCHDLTDLPVVHADCIQSMGGNSNLTIDHNALWSRDTSDILLGQEFGDARNVVINNNRLMSIGSPPPAYLFYVSGTNTQVTNNRFTRRYTYGPCTLNTKNPVVWQNNVWDDDGSPLTLSAC